MNTSSSPFLVRPATEGDVDAIAHITYAAFDKMIPYLRPLAQNDREGFLASARDRSRKIISGAEGAAHCWTVAVSPEAKEVAAVARWERISNACALPFEPSTTSAFGGPPQVEFFNNLHKMHRDVMKERPHYCLHILCTHPSYQRQGAASALLQHITRTADDEGLPLYVEAAPGSVPVYEKFGWAPVEKLWLPAIEGLPEDFELIMLREPGSSASGHGS